MGPKLVPVQPTGRHGFAGRSGAGLSSDDPFLARPSDHSPMIFWTAVSVSHSALAMKRKLAIALS